MAKQTKQLTPPKGMARAFFRMPIWLYNHGLGWMMGKRMVLLNHVGRKSGTTRQAVLEVAKYDPERHEVVVCVGFGPKSQWYQNLLAQPKVSIQLGNEKWDVTAKQLTPDEGGKVFQAFAQRNPSEVKFTGALGFETDGTPDDYYDMGRQMIFMEFAPRG